MGKSNYGAVIELDDKEAAFINEYLPGSAATSEKVSLIAGALVRDMARGGIMLSPDAANRIKRAIHTDHEMTIVEAVERSANRDGEAVMIRWRVDPTQIAFYQSLADANAISLEHQLKAVLDYAHLQGWVNMAAPTPFQLLFTPEQFRWLQEKLLKDIVTGEDVVNLVADHDRPPFDHDPVLDSLRGEA